MSFSEYFELREQKYNIIKEIRGLNQLLDFYKARNRFYIARRVEKLEYILARIILSTYDFGASTNSGHDITGFRHSAMNEDYWSGIPSRLQKKKSLKGFMVHYTIGDLAMSGEHEQWLDPDDHPAFVMSNKDAGYSEQHDSELKYLKQV